MAQASAWTSPRTPHRELIEAENADLFAGLEAKGWAAYAEADAEADFFDLGTEDDPMKVVKEHLLAALRRTGSIGSAHRKDMVETLRAAKPSTVALGVATAPTVETKPPRGGL